MQRVLLELVVARPVWDYWSPRAPLMSLPPQIRRDQRNALVLKSSQSFLLMASQSGVGRDDAGEEGPSFWGAVLRGDVDEVLT